MRIDTSAPPDKSFNMRVSQIQQKIKQNLVSQHLIRLKHALFRWRSLYNYHSSTIIVLLYACLIIKIFIGTLLFAS